MLCDAALLLAAKDVLFEPWQLLVSDTAWNEIIGYGLMWVLMGLVTLFAAILGERSEEGGVPRFRDTTLVACVSAAIAPVVVAAVLVLPGVRATRSVFVTAPVAVPDRIASAPREVRDSSETASKGRVNVLLMGGDAGPRRWGLRTDALHVVSLDLDTLDAAVISIPRNLQNAPMPAGLAKRFPRGFQNLANAVYGWGEANPLEVRAALGETDAPGATLTAAMVAELTGLQIDAWVVVDMAGFLGLIDAFGGVDVWVEKYVKTPGNVVGGKHALRDFTPGWHAMDGTDALAYSRARKTDSDYHRMTRQRCVLASLAAQTSAPELAWRWGAIAEVMQRSVRTNATAELLSSLKEVVGTDPGRARVLSLNPPLVPERGWELDEVRALVRDVVTPPQRLLRVPAEVQDQPALTTSTLPAPRGADSATADVSAQCRTRR